MVDDVGARARTRSRDGARGERDRLGRPGREVRRPAHRPRRQRDDLDRGAEPGGDGLDGGPVGGSPRRSTSAASTYRSCGATACSAGDRVERGASGGQLVVDQDERRGTGERRRIGRQQPVRGGVTVLLLEPGPRRDGADHAPRRVQVGRAQCLGDAVPQPRRRLGEAEHRRRGAGQPVGDEAAELEPGAVDRAAGRPGTCLPSTADTSRCARRGLRRSASPTRSDSGRRRPGPSCSVTPNRVSTQPSLTSGELMDGERRRAAARTTRPRGRRRTAHRAGRCAGPTPGAACSRSSCCRSWRPRHRPARRRRGCPARPPTPPAAPPTGR